jgi:3-phenylpropionate/trans-cinnamate dioxygenase ferredoxin reductase subunit
MEQNGTLLIIGGGLAGAKAAEGARSAGHEGRIVLLAEEDALPYERPPLSKEILRADAAPDSSRVHDAGYYDEQSIELITGNAVDRLDVASRKVHVADGDTFAFDAAVIATGAAPRRLRLPGAELGGVHYLRTLDDSLRLQEAIKGARRVAVVGAGWIGSEVAASARQMGAEVVLIEPFRVPLHRVLGTQIGEVFAQLHADHGVALRLGAGVSELRGTGSVEQVVLSDGRTEDADVVVAGIGVTPRLELAIEAGLAIAEGPGGGIVTDEHLRTSAPGIYAAGDVASAWHPHYQRHLRVEHWANALNQGAAAGANAVGRGEPYTRLPYFFSDQYDLGMEYVGYADADDEVAVRGDLAGREFVAFYHRDGIIKAAMNVNVWDVGDDLRALIGAGRPVDLARLTDPDVALAEVLPAAQ